MRLSTGSVAETCAAHRWRTAATWFALIVVALAMVVLLLRLTTGGEPTSNPDSRHAKSAIARAFPDHGRRESTDVVIVRSPQYRAVAPQFRGFVTTEFVHPTRARVARRPLCTRQPVMPRLS
jgi:hypothetical protein